MSKVKLPPRRDNATIEIKHGPRDAETTYRVTFGLDGSRVIKEVFCEGLKVGSMAQAIIRDGCILLSRALQRGETIEELAQALGEDRAEGEREGPPSSPLGAIARAGAGWKD